MSPAAARDQSSPPSKNPAPLRLAKVLRVRTPALRSQFCRRRGDETHFKFGFWISVRVSSRRLLRHGAGEPSAIPLKIRAPGFAGRFGARIVPNPQRVTNQVRPEKSTRSCLAQPLRVGTTRAPWSISQESR